MMWWGGGVGWGWRIRPHIPHPPLMLVCCTKCTEISAPFLRCSEQRLQDRCGGGGFVNAALFPEAFARCHFPASAIVPHGHGLPPSRCTPQVKMLQFAAVPDDQAAPPRRPSPSAPIAHVPHIAVPHDASPGPQAPGSPGPSPGPVAATSAQKQSDPVPEEEAEAASPLQSPARASPSPPSSSAGSIDGDRARSLPPARSRPCLDPEALEGGPVAGVLKTPTRTNSLSLSVYLDRISPTTPTPSQRCRAWSLPVTPLLMPPSDLLSPALLSPMTPSPVVHTSPLPGAAPAAGFRFPPSPDLGAPLGDGDSEPPKTDDPPPRAPRDPFLERLGASGFVARRCALWEGRAGQEGGRENRQDRGENIGIETGTLA